MINNYSKKMVEKVNDTSFYGIELDENLPMNLTKMASQMLDPDQGDKSDRMGFIRKVYGILSVQLLITALGIAAVQLSPQLHVAMQGQAALALTSFIVSVII